MSGRSAASTDVGDTVGPVTVPVRRETLVAYAGASGDQNPIHQDEAFARYLKEAAELFEGAGQPLDAARCEAALV